MGESSDRHELEERRAALRQLMPVVERLRGLDGVTWAGGQRHPLWRETGTFYSSDGPRIFPFGEAGR